MNIKLGIKQAISVSSSEDIYTIMQRILMRENRIDRNREHFWTISLDAAHRILNIELVSLGSVRQTLAEPMEVFSIPLQKRAVKLVLVHNHPSGSLKPGEGDKDTTDRLIQVGRILQVPVLDHLIITEKSYYSFADSGLLKELEASIKYVPAYELKRRYEQAAQETGVKKGAEQKAQEMAKAMKKNGEPIEKIIAYTGLTKQAIQRLKD
jgi:DNA repair protein RadC